MDELCNDNASSQISEKVQEILRWFYIKQTTSEPHHQHQNPVEGQIGNLLVLTNQVLDRRNAPEQFWYLALQWVIDVDNIIATERGGQIASPIQRAFGVTPDCPKLLVHIFFDPVYFYDADHGGSKERPG